VKILVLGLGNELLADDAIGVLAARELEPRLGEQADVVASSLHGLALLDVLAGHDAAVIIDAVCSGQRPAGTVFELDPAELAPVPVPSPHFAGLPEMLELARRLELRFPEKFRIVAVEVRDPLTIGGVMTPEVRQALPEICETVSRLVKEISAGLDAP
jgi:hydrogenase maturation protease